jgi:hypothetical protein
MNAIFDGISAAGAFDFIFNVLASKQFLHCSSVSTVIAIGSRAASQFATGRERPVKSLM